MPRPERAHDGEGDCPDRAGRDRPRQATADRPGDRDAHVRRAGLQGERDDAHSTEGPVAHGDHRHADVRSGRGRSVVERAAAAGRGHLPSGLPATLR